MARPLRIQYAGARYHVMSRGDRRQNIFRSDKDRILFLETLARACGKTQWQVHAYCLMSNHFHLVVETPGGNLVAGMKWLLGTYTMRFNRTHRYSGHLFGGRYKAQLIDESAAGYLRTAADYVHLNPARAGLLGKGQNLATYCWSSYPAYLAAARKRPGWLRVDRVLGEHGLARDDAKGRREFERRLESQRQTPDETEVAVMRTGWRLGGEDFLDRLLERWNGKWHEHHGGKEKLETDLERARRLIADELARRGWTAKQLALERKGHAVKVAIARRLREETTMPLKWIAAELRIGTWTHLNRLLHIIK
ncbi:MAG TPA: transposase [Chthoniobacterales bacterium]|nr:transposase [Chthoniobacterales bacterium]